MIPTLRPGFAKIPSRNMCDKLTCNVKLIPRYTLFDSSRPPQIVTVTMLTTKLKPIFNDLACELFVMSTKTRNPPSSRQQV